MVLKSYTDFISESKSNPWIYEGNFRVNKDMVTDGKFNQQMPDVVNGSFYCSELNLTTLKGCPKEVNNVFWCDHNQLTSLKGCPKKVNGNFWCDENQLISLEHAPKHLRGHFYCDNELEIEARFINSGSYKEDYWNDLLKYMLKEGIALEKVLGWPEGFLDENLKQVSQSMMKYNL